MPIKTILLHMANDDAHANRLAVAASLAKRFSAHIQALYIATPVSMRAWPRRLVCRPSVPVAGRNPFAGSSA